VERKIIEDFWNNEYKQITALEKKQRKEIAEVIEKYSKICLNTPITLYILTADELSTRGYGAFLDFYAYVIDLQVKFVRFIIDRTYYNDHRILVSFIKGDENLFQGKSKLPPGFRKGVMLNLGYIIILYLISFFLFKKSLHKISKEEIARLGDVNLKMENKNLYVWLKKKNYFSKALFNLFSGNFKKMKKKGFRGKVVINGHDIAGEKNKEEFQYLCHPDFLPGDIKVRHFISFYAGMLKISAKEIRDVIKSSGLDSLFGKPFSKLTNKERFAVMMPFLKIGKKRIYLIDDIATGLPIECGIELNELMKDLASKGCLVIYLTSTIRADGEAVKMKEYFHEGMTGWETLIGQNKITLEYEKKIQGKK
jgi:ABC-type transport system involved in cytochrome c biogenesis ATPase subunit